MRWIFEGPPELLGVQLDDEVLFDRKVDIFTSGNCNDLGNIMGLIHIEPLGNHAGSVSFEAALELVKAAAGFLQFDGLANADEIGRNVDLLTIDGEVTVADELTGLCTAHGETETINNVIYRLGFAATRRQARQLVSHAHFTVNGKKVNIPSYLIRVGDVIEVKESSRSSVQFKRLTAEDAPVVLLPQWLERDKNSLKGTVTRLPVREDVDMPIEEHLIVELYSK